MFDISAPELITILIIALIVFGPQRLPDLARRLAKWTSEFRRAAREVRTGLEEEVKALKDPIDEIKADIENPLKALKEPIDEIRADIENPLRETAAELDDLGRELKSGIAWTGPEPESGPTSEDAKDDLAEIERTDRPIGDPDEQPGDSGR